MKKITTQAMIKTFSNQGNEKSIIRSVISFIEHADNISISMGKIENIQAALKEAVDNVLSFAYPNKQGIITVYISIYDNNLLRLKIRDFGSGIKNVNEAILPLFSTETKRAGMGFTIMNTFSDKLTVKSILGKGTTVIMDFKL